MYGWRNVAAVVACGLALGSALTFAAVRITGWDSSQPGATSALADSGEAPGNPEIPDRLQPPRGASRQPKLADLVYLASKGLLTSPPIGTVPGRIDQPAPGLVPESAFDSEQIVSYYGFPGTPSLGALGQGTEDQMIARLESQVAAYQAVNSQKTVVPALHLIYEVAQASTNDDGLYLNRADDGMVNHLIQLAQQNNMLLFLDLQIGRSNLQDELGYVLPYLKYPWVHLAIDPEFVTPSGEVPGEDIGTLDCLDINQALDRVEALAEENNLPNKIVMVHQFRDDMLTNKDKLRFDEPRVDTVLDMDGYGPQAQKLGSYDREVTQFGPKYAGIKLFYKEDTNLLSEQQVEKLTPRPDVIIYQ